MQQSRRLGASHEKILISHNNDYGVFGDFLADLLVSIDSDLRNEIMFTSNPLYEVPRGYATIYDYLQDFFRDEVFTIFLFSESFYNSNSCLAEAGAAWATGNRKERIYRYSIFVIAIDFTDVEKPIENTFPGVNLCEPKAHLTDSISREIYENIFPHIEVPSVILVNRPPRMRKAFGRSALDPFPAM